MSRASLRADLLAQRLALDPARLAALSRQVVDRFAERSGIADSAWRGLQVGLYRPLSGELDPRGLETRLLGLGAELYFPRVKDAQARLMELAQGDSSPGEWRKGPYGNDEPSLGVPALNPSHLDVIFVPGVAFGLQGERLGLGSGFYDRYLPLATRALRISLAFDFQLLPKLEQGSWDQRMDWIWTERRQILLRAFSPKQPS